MFSTVGSSRACSVFCVLIMCDFSPVWDLLSPALSLLKSPNSACHKK